jgi:hypothetical protein
MRGFAGDQDGGQEETDQRGEAAGAPHRVPVRLVRDQQRGDGDADSDACEMQGAEGGSAGAGEAIHHQGRGDDQDEGAGGAADEAQQQEGRHAVRQPHRAGGRGADGEGAEQPGAFGAGQADAGDAEGPGEVAGEVGGGDEAGGGFAEMQGGDHRRQNGGVDEASDADADRHRDHAAQCRRDGFRVRVGHGGAFTAALR